MKKLKEQRNRNETGLKQKYMKLANLRRILGDALLNNFQVKKRRRAVRNKICPPARQCCGSGSVFGPGGSGSVSQMYGSGSGSFYHHAKIVRKTLIPTVMLLLFDFLSLKNDVNINVQKEKTRKENYK